MDISVRISDAQYAELQAFLSSVPDKVDRAASGAINRTIQTGSTRIRRELARLAKMPVRRFGKRVRPLKTDAAELVGKIRILNFNIPLAKTGIIPSKGGFFPLAKMNTGQTLQNTPFKATMRSGHTGWFVRFGAKRLLDPTKMTDKSRARYAKALRQPIKEIYAPSPRKLWEETPGLAAEQLSQLGDVLQKNLASQVDRFLSASR